MNSPAPSFNPFPGLRPFQMEEEHLFFGREAQRNELIALLREQRFVAVMGASGSGKSSLVRAGLLPALYGGALVQAGSHWQIALMRPGGSPIANLAAALLETDLWDEGEPPAQLDLETTLSRSGLGLVEAVRQARMPSRTNLLVVVDQFEELFRFSHSQSERATRDEATAFVNLLIEAARQTSASIYVVLTMRSDFFGDCAQFEELADAINRGEYLVPRLTRDQKKQAIEGPARVGGSAIAPALLQRLLNDVGDDPDQLPILQHALMRTWDHWRADHAAGEALELRHYEGIGGMREALSRHADEVYAELPDDRRRSVAGKIFKALTERGSDNRGIRRPTRISDLCAIVDASAREVVETVEAFRKAGRTFLMPSEGVELRSGTVIDISHESLMRVWQRLRDWVEQEAQSARIYRRLADTAALHAEGKAGLYHDPDLQIALSWRDGEQPTEAWAGRYHSDFGRAMEFLSRSAAERRAAEEAREAARQKELAQAKALAQTERERAEEQVRFSARLKWMVRGLGLVAMVALAAFFAAFLARREAQRLAQLADASRAEAVTAANHLNTNLTRSFFITATEQFAAGRTDNGLAYLARALRTDPSFWPAAFQIYQTLTERSFPLDPPRSIRMNRPIAYWSRTKDGRRILTEDDAAQIWLWDANTMTRIVDFSEGQRSGWFFFSPDGRYAGLRSYAEDGSIRIFDAEDGRSIGPVIPQQRGLGVYHFSPATNGPMRVLVDHKEDGSVQIWDVALGRFCTPRLKTAGRLLIEGGAVPRSLFTPDGNAVVAAFDDRTAAAWNAADGMPMLPSLSHKVQVSDLGVSPDSRFLVLLSMQDQAVVWQDLQNPATPPRRVEFAFPPRLFQFSPDGARLVVAGWERDEESKSYHIRVYDLAGGQQLVAVDEPKAYRYFFLSDSGTRRLRSWVLVSMHDKGSYLKAWDLDSGASLCTIHFEDSPIEHSVISPDGSRIATIQKNFKVHLWDVFSGAPLIEPLKHQGEQQLMEFSPDGERLLTFSETDATARAWDSRTGALVYQTPPLQGGGIGNPEFAADRDTVIAHQSGFTRLSDGISRQTHGTLLLWDLAASSANVVPLPTTGSPNDVQFSPDGSRVAVAQRDERRPGAQLFDSATGRPLRYLRHPEAISTVEYSPDGRHLLTAAADKTVRIWGLESGKIELNLDHEGPVRLARYSPDGRMIVTVSLQARVRVWDARMGVPLFPAQDHGGYVMEVAFSPDGGYLATSSMDGQLRVLDALTGRQIASDKHDSGCAGLAFTPDSTRVISSSFGGHVRLLNIARDELEWSSAESDYFLDAAFHPNGEVIAAASGGNSEDPFGTIYLWNWRQNRLLMDPLPNRGQVYPPNLQFSPDGRLLASSDTSGTLFLWETTSGKRLASLPAHRQRRFDESVDYGGGVQFVPDSMRLAQADVHGSGRIVELPPASAPIPDWLPDLAELAAGKKIDAEGGSTTVDRARAPDLRARIALSTNTGSHALWGRWILTPAAKRTVHPASALTRGEYALRLSNSENLTNRFQALLLAPTNGLVYARIAHQWAVTSLRTNVPPTGTNHWRHVAQWYSDQATNLAYGSAETWALRAATFDALRDPARTTAAAARAVELGPDNPNAWYVRALDLQQRGELESAYQAFAKALDLLPNRAAPELASDITRPYLIGALRWLADLEDASPLAAAREAVARLADRGQADPRKIVEADWLTRRTVEVAPEDAAAWLLRANALFEPAQEEQALQALRKAIDPDPQGRIPWPSLANFYRIRANILESLNRHGESHELLLARTIPRRDTPVLPEHFRAVDLGGVYNVSFAEDPHRGRSLSTDEAYYFHHLTPGRHEFHGVPFDARGAAMVLGGGLASRNLAKPYTRAITNIVVNAPAHWLHFLQFSAFVGDRDRTVASYRLHYADATSSDLPVVIYQDSADWIAGPHVGLSHARIAWSEGDPNNRRQIYHAVYENPHPEKPIRSIDLISEMDDPSTALVALTLESPALENALQTADARTLAERAWILLTRTKGIGKAGFAEADRLTRLAHARNPADLEIALARARVLARIGQPAEARRLLDGPLADLRGDYRRQFIQASALAAEGRTDESRSAFDQAARDSAALELVATAERQDYVRQAVEWMRTRDGSEASLAFEVAANVPRRDPLTPASAIDLGPRFNASLVEEWYTQANLPNLGLILAGLPRGLAEFQGVAFDVRGIIQLLDRKRNFVRTFPYGVSNIPVGRKTDALHFLGGTIKRDRIGTPVARFVIHHASGATNLVVARWGMEAADITIGRDRPASGNPVWRGAGTFSSGVGDGVVGMFSWENPTPEDPIASIDFLSAMSESAPYLAAISAEEFLQEQDLSRLSASRLSELAVHKSTPAANPGPRSLAYARTLSDAAIRLGPEDPAVWLSRSRYLTQVGDLTNALAAVDRSLAILPQEPAAMRQRVELLTRLKEFDALSALRPALRKEELRRGIPARAPDTAPKLIDLSAVYNRSLDEPLHAQNGTDTLNWEGLRGLPRGQRQLGGVSFDLRGVVVLGGKQSAMRSMTHEMPYTVTNIAVRLKTPKLHFLHGLGWGTSLPHGTVVGHYRIHFADGRQEQIPLTVGVDLRDWWLVPGAKHSITAGSLAWSGHSTTGLDHDLGLYTASWVNPHPEVEIASLDMVSSMTDGAPFVVAVTAE